MPDISRFNLTPLNTGEEPVDNSRMDSAAYALGLFVTTTLLIAFGLTMLYSASYTQSGSKYFYNQLLWIIIGSAGALTAIAAGFRRISRWRVPILLFCWLLLIVAATCFPKINGAARWIRITLPGFGVLSIQPSEFAKIALCFYVAAYCAEFSRSFTYLKERWGLIPVGVVIAITCGLVIAGHDWGTTLLIGTSAMAILFAAGLLWRYILLIVASCATLGISYIVLFDPMRLWRIISAFLMSGASSGEQMKLAQGKGYQLYNSLMALGSGGWFGLGFGESRLKNRYLPEQHTDFILAVVGEELGLVSLWFVLFFYMLWGFFALRISLRCQSRLGMLLGFGLTVAIEVQALINLAVISGSAPTKGMPAPFISYGGSNLAASMFAVGVLLSIALENSFPNYSDNFFSSIKRKVFGK